MASLARMIRPCRQGVKRGRSGGANEGLALDGSLPAIGQSRSRSNAGRPSLRHLRSANRSDPAGDPGPPGRGRSLRSRPPPTSVAGCRAAPGHRRAAVAAGAPPSVAACRAAPGHKRAAVAAGAPTSVAACKAGARVWARSRRGRAGRSPSASERARKARVAYSGGGSSARDSHRRGWWPS
jgi:hypothetical protein